MKRFLTSSLFVSSFLLIGQHKNPVSLWQSLYDVPHFSAKDRTMLATELYYLMKENPSNNPAIDASFDEFYALREQCNNPFCFNALVKAYEESLVASYAHKNVREQNRCWRTSLLSFYKALGPEHQKITYGADAGKELPAPQLIEDILNWRPQPTHAFYFAMHTRANAFFVQCSVTHRI